jgi:RHS repeat-associated protein
MIERASVEETPCAILTGKERDTESGLDFFGARYYSGPHGRFTSVDPVVQSSKHLEYPQRWNAYAYVRNNPLALVDPDGADDFYVFRPLATNTTKAWAAIQAQAPKYGHTVTILNAEGTTVDWTQAVQKEGAHVVFTGHTLEDPRTKAAGGIRFSDGAIGLPDMYIPGENGGPVQLLTPVSGVQAADVAIFGCNCSGLQQQYSGTTFTGTDPVVNTAASDVGAAAYVDRMVRNGTVDQAATAAQKAMANTTNKANANPNREQNYPKPKICTTSPDGKTTCQQ